MLIKGEIDVLDRPLFKDVDRVKEEYPEIQIMGEREVGWSWDFMRFQAREGTPWSQSGDKREKIRQALSYAIDRTEIVNAIYDGFAKPTDTFLPHSSFIGYEEPPIYFPMTADVEKAKQLLAEGGYPKGFEMGAIVAERVEWRQALQLLQNQLSKVGITLTIENLDAETYASRQFVTKDFDIPFENGDVFGVESDYMLSSFYKNGSIGDGGFITPEVDALVREQGASENHSERDIIGKQIQHIAIPQVQWIWICNTGLPRLARDNVKNFKVMQPSNFHLKT